MGWWKKFIEMPDNERAVILAKASAGVIIVLLYALGGASLYLRSHYLQPTTNTPRSQGAPVSLTQEPPSPTAPSTLAPTLTPSLYPTITPTYTPVPPSPTPMPTATQEAPVTATPFPSPTPAPTSTPEPTATATTEPTPTEEPTALPTEAPATPTEAVEEPTITPTLEQLGPPPRRSGR